MTSLNWIFAARNASARKLEILRWWESRRLAYNLIVWVVGISAIIVMELIAARITPTGEDFVEPLALIMGVLAFGIAANICYSLGWVLELTLTCQDADIHRKFREKYFRRGLLFSCWLASLPVWAAALYAITEMVSRLR